MEGAIHMPLRVPPPKANNAIEQWIIDSLLHLDECIDDGKTQTREQMDEMKHAQAEFRAEVTAALAAKEADHTGILARLNAHDTEHKALEQVKKAQAGVWRTQGKWAAWLVERVTQGGVIAGALWVISQVF